MQKERQPKIKAFHFSFYLKGGSILLLLSLSFLIIACGSSNTTTANLDGPPVTVTINFKSANFSSLGTVAPYLCGAWTYDTTPGFSPGSEIPVYAHFVHNVNGNPVGVSGASAQATVEWADGGRDSRTATTTSDGLAVFYFTIPNQPDMIGKNNLVMVSFTAPNGQTCNVDNQPQPAAYFTLIAASPTPTATPSAQPTVESVQTVISTIDTPVTLLHSGKNHQAVLTPTPTPTPCTNPFGCG
jgi:hypothetical protein